MKALVVVLASIALASVAHAGALGDLARQHGSAPARSESNAGASHPAAVSNRGVQLTPDFYVTGTSGQILVSADVGNERWAIAGDIATDAVTGNIFFPGGGDPAFVWCAITDAVGTAPNSTLFLSCLGAQSCPPSGNLGGTCFQGQWSDLGQVTLPGTFFIP